MDKKENQRIALTKRLLKESLLKLMSKKRIQDITVSELCALAEINRTTFYNHYGCPADVLADIEHSVITDLEHHWQRDGAGKHWPLNKRVEELCSYLLERKELSKLLFRNSDTNSGFASLLLNATHVHATYEQELFYARSQESKQLVITFLTNGTYHMIRQWLLEDVPKTPKEMGDLVYLVATKGWARPSGESQAASR